MLVCLCLLAGSLLPHSAHAFRARVIHTVTQGTDIVVSQPELRAQWYDELRGLPRVYHVVSPTAFRLYIEIRIVDREPPLAQDFTYTVIELSQGAATPDRVLFEGDAAEATWERVYDWVDGYWYFVGPTFDREVPAGRYRVEVTSPDDRGKYQLVTGHTYDLTLIYEFFKSLSELPAAATFYGRSPLSIVQSPFALVFVGALLGLFFWLARIYRYLNNERPKRVRR
jgi:hypothetical protein